MNNGTIATVTTVIHTPRERVWRALLDPDTIAGYLFGIQLTTDWQEGSPMHWRGAYPGCAFEDHGRVLKVREPELLRYALINGRGRAEHTITLELKEAEGVTRLRLTQDRMPSAAAQEATEQKWATAMDGLKKLLGDAPLVPPDESRPGR